MAGDKGFIRETADYCPNCGQHALMAYDTKNKPIHYVAKNRTATTDSIMEKVNNTTIKEFICTSCGRHFLCDFSLGFPRAIDKEGLYLSFFNGYFYHNK